MRTEWKPSYDQNEDLVYEWWRENCAESSNGGFGNEKASTIDVQKIIKNVTLTLHGFLKNRKVFDRVIDDDEEKCYNAACFANKTSENAVENKELTCPWTSHMSPYL